MNKTVDKQTAPCVLFAYGFRPFFLLAGLYAAISVAAWLWVYRNGGWPLQSLPPQHWHGHEMIFGFISAGIAGFLLTAVPNWTGSRALAGPPLVALVLLWLAGRVAFSLGEFVPLWLLAVGELGFLPALLFAIAPSLLRAGNRNWPMLGLLAAFLAADATFIAGVATHDALLSRTALLAALDIVLVLITIIGGRIVPAFTGNALRASGVQAVVRSSPVVERLVLLSMLAMLLGDVLVPHSYLTAAIVAVAAALQLWRLAGWLGWRTVKQPIVWVLHLAYLWLPVGLALKAASLAGDFGWAAHWMHSLGAGAAGMMIMAVMTRASLGHTGRPLQAHTIVAVAYGLLAVAVIVRVFGPNLLAMNYASAVLVSAALWIAAFVAYLAIYGPILVRPRADGKPG
jgi:uncharacterized protein involved in response to NO